MTAATSHIIFDRISVDSQDSHSTCPYAQLDFTTQTSTFKTKDEPVTVCFKQSQMYYWNPEKRNTKLGLQGWLLTTVHPRIIIQILLFQNQRIKT